MQQSAVEFAKSQYGTSEEETRRGLFGSVADVRAGVRHQIDEGCEEILVFQLPRVHATSLMRFSQEVIPEFAQH